MTLILISIINALTQAALISAAAFAFVLWLVDIEDGKRDY